MDTQQLQAWLQAVQPLPPTDWVAFEACLRPVHCSKGTVLTEVGQVQREMYFVVQGVQMSFFEGLKKQHVVAFTYPPGPCAIPDSFLHQTPSQHTLVCLTDSHLLALSYSQLQQLLDASQPLERLFRKAAEGLLAGAIQRQVELQSLTIEQRFLAFARRSAHLFQVVPHKYLASYLDMDPTNFSKLYNTHRIG
jgi:CRP-like cAMP-binding protein